MTDSELARALEKVVQIPFSTCWHWIGAANTDGYGMMLSGHKKKRGDYKVAHRSFYETYNPGCVRPDHLEAVTQRENLLRGLDTLARNQAQQTECVRGHPLDRATREAHYTGRDGVVRYQRRCRACVRENQKRRLAAFLVS